METKEKSRKNLLMDQVNATHCDGIYGGPQGQN